MGYKGHKGMWGKDTGKKQGLAPPSRGPNASRGEPQARPFSANTGRKVGLEPHPVGHGHLHDEHTARPFGDEGKLIGETPHPIGHGSRITDEGPK
jgi:hypothetical protein